MTGAGEGDDQFGRFVHAGREGGRAFVCRIELDNGVGAVGSRGVEVGGGGGLDGEDGAAIDGEGRGGQGSGGERSGELDSMVVVTFWLRPKTWVTAVTERMVSEAKTLRLTAGPPVFAASCA